MKILTIWMARFMWTVLRLCANERASAPATNQFRVLELRLSGHKFFLGWTGNDNNRRSSYVSSHHCSAIIINYDYVYCLAKVLIWTLKHKTNIRRLHVRFLVFLPSFVRSFVVCLVASKIFLCVVVFLCFAKLLYFWRWILRQPRSLARSLTHWRARIRDARQTIGMSHKLNHVSNEIFTSFLTEFGNVYHFAVV